MVVVVAAESELYRHPNSQLVAMQLSRLLDLQVRSALCCSFVAAVAVVRKY